MTALPQSLLFLSSYAPLLAVFALLDTFGAGAPSLACAAAAGLGVVLLPLMLWRAGRLTPASLTVESATPRDADVLAYVASYLVPFAGAAADTGRQRIAVGLFILLIAVLYVRSELFHVNPLLALAGLRTYAVQTPGGTPVVLLCRRRFVPRGAHLGRPGQRLRLAGASVSRAPDPHSALAALAAIPTGGSPELLVVARAAADPPELAATRPTDRLAEALRAIVLDVAADWADRELVDYDPVTTVGDGQVMWAAAADVPLLAFPELGRDPADLPLFDPDSPYAAHLRLQAIRMPTPAGIATFYRELRPRQVIARSGRLTILRRADRMDLLDGPALVIDRGVDAIAVAGVALFVDRGRFQRVFGFLDQLRQQAATTFDEVTRHLAIDGLTELRAAATSQPAMLAKMASIERKLDRFPAYRQALTMPSLLAFVRAHPETGVEVSGSGGSARLVFRADVQHRFKILKLLDDDFLQSQLTLMRYEANSKGPPLS